MTVNAHVILGLVAIILFVAAAALNDARAGWLGLVMLTIAIILPGG